MNIGTRIKSRRKQLKMTVDELANTLGKNRATIYRYESSEIENMPIDIVEPLAKALRITPSYLMGWENGDKNNLKEESNFSYNYYPESVSAGLPINIDGITEEFVENIKIPNSLMGKWAGSKDIFIMRVNGESMNRTIPHHSLIAVKKLSLNNLCNGDIVVYSHNNEYSVKKVYKHEDILIFRPDSTDERFADYVARSDDVNLVIHGKVVIYIVEQD
ncbi:LexA family protein [Paraliobacillus zengyii]|uniref:LexA family protein n=1 Tax=Paraliobacillus zengyii TaxID=2213194 RepID=UPI000DD45ACB|nr:XRE family transcriptional regulator [Paraliobacillus zengyii]